MLNEDHLTANSLVQKFTAAWQSDERPSVHSYLKLCNQPDEIRSLIVADLERRWSQADSRPTAKEHPQGSHERAYLEDYASMLDDTATYIFTSTVVAEEYRIRLQSGDHPSHDEYRQRFPWLEADLEQELERVERKLFVEASTFTSMQDESVGRGDAVTIDRGLPATKPPTVQPPKVASPHPLIGKYQTRRLLGRGGFGEVWLAEHPQLKRMVAIKIPRRDRPFSSREAELFLRESQRLASLHHIPGIVKVLDADRDREVPFIVSDYIDGESLANRLLRKPYTASEAAELVAKLARSLHRAHLCGLTHRDIKPANILLDRTGDPHLADFGLSVTEVDQQHELPATLGTLAYMSPEQARGDSHLVDGRTDIYSLGVVLYQLLTQRLPFIAVGIEGYRQQILSREPRPPRMINDQIPSELERICLKCLQKNISDRYTTAGDLAQELTRACEVPVQSSPSKYWLAATAAGVVACMVWIAILGFRLLGPQQQAASLPVPQPSETLLTPPRPVSDDNAVQPPKVAPTVQNAVVRPETLLTSKNGQTNFFRINDAAKSLYVAGDAYYLVKLGELGQKDTTLEFTIDVSKLTSDFGTAGVFVGYRDAVNSDEREFQTLHLQLRPDGTARSRRTTYRLSSEHTTFNERRELTSKAVDSTRRVNVLTLKIVQGTVNQILWNSQVIEQFEAGSSESPIACNGVGSFGVFVDQSVAVFSAFRKDGVLQEFQSNP